MSAQVSGRLLDADEVAELLRVPKSWVYAESRRWEKTNGAAGIPTVTLGRYRRFRSDAIEDWLRGLERGTECS